MKRNMAFVLASPDSVRYPFPPFSGWGWGVRMSLYQVEGSAKLTGTGGSELTGCLPPLSTQIDEPVRFPVSEELRSATIHLYQGKTSENS